MHIGLQFLEVVEEFLDLEYLVRAILRMLQEMSIYLAVFGAILVGNIFTSRAVKCVRNCWPHGHKARAYQFFSIAG